MHVISQNYTRTFAHTFNAHTYTHAHTLKQPHAQTITLKYAYTARNPSDLALGPHSTPETILLVRTVAHLVCASLSAGPDSLLAFFNTALLRPERLRGTWLPTQPEDVQAMAVRVPPPPPPL